MTTIDIDIKALDDSITKLKGLRDKCNDFNGVKLSVVGGGETITELENISLLYQNLNVHMAELIGKTAMFMENVKSSYETSDQKAAAGIRGDN